MANKNILGFNLTGSDTYYSRPYGTCSTAATTAAKAVTWAGFILTTGATILVKFSNANSASSPTLNVNSTGAKTIIYHNAALTSSLYYWSAGDVCEFVYDGTYWVLMNVGNTDTWRGITDSYSGTSTTTSLSQKGANDLYNALLNGHATTSDNSTDTYYFRKRGTITGSTDKNAGKYIKFARITVNAYAYDQCGGYMFIYDSEANYFHGILAFYLRASNTIATTSITLKWLTLTNSNYVDSISAVKVADSVYDLYFQHKHSWSTIEVQYLSTTHSKIDHAVGSFVDSISPTAISSCAVSLSGHTHTKNQITDFSHTHTKSQITDFSHTHDYLPLSGGNLTGNLTWSANTGNNTCLPGHIYRNTYDSSGNVYDHYFSGTTSTYSYANLRVKNGSSYRTLVIGGDGTLTWNGTSISLNGHTHDDRYYTESEVNTKLSGKSDVGHNHNYIVSPYYYNQSVISSDTTADTIFGQTSSESKMTCGFMSSHPLFGNYADVAMWTGYCKWGGTQFAAEYNAINPRVAIRKYNQTRSNWGDWTEFITTANIGSQSVNYATSAGSASSATNASYATSAGSATTASNANCLSSTGWGNSNLTYLQTSNDFFGNSGWAHYIIANHGSGETYYNFTLALPFWDTPKYKRLEGGTEDGWHDFLTSENYTTWLVPKTGGTFSGSVTATAFYQSSDERLKNFHDAVDVDLDKLAELKKSYFTFKDSDDKMQIGVSAQEIQRLYPELVSEDETGYLSVAYDKLSVIALAAIDELDNKVNELEERLKKLEQLIK